MAKASAISVEDYYSADDDMRTLVRAEEIRKDKKRFAAAQACAKKKIEDMENVFGEDDEADDKKK
jgi:hypothetical protein